MGFPPPQLVPASHEAFGGRLRGLRDGDLETAQSREARESGYLPAAAEAGQPRLEARVPRLEGGVLQRHFWAKL